MRILVTRPIEDARATAKVLQTLGHEPIVAPLLEIRFRERPPIDLEGVQALLATSANGIRALARLTARRDVPVFAVGPQTEEAARNLGFTSTRSAHGNGEVLAKAVIGWASPDKGELFHAAGSETKGSLSAALQTHGFRARTETLYDAIAADKLPEAARLALEEQRLDAVMLFSPRTARCLADAVAAAHLQQFCKHVIAIAISDAAAQPLKVLNFREIRVAAHPDQDGMLACIG